MTKFFDRLRDVFAVFVVLTILVASVLWCTDSINMATKEWVQKAILYRHGTAALIVLFKTIVFVFSIMYEVKITRYNEKDNLDGDSFLQTTFCEWFSGKKENIAKNYSVLPKDSLVSKDGGGIGFGKIA